MLVDISLIDRIRLACHLPGMDKWENEALCVEDEAT